MALPKALLYNLDDRYARSAEEKLRGAGFATAVLNASELNREQRDWMQLSEVIADTAVAFVLVGEDDAFTAEELCKVSILALSLPGNTAPCIIFVRPTTENGLPEWMSYVETYHEDAPFAAKLMARRFRPRPYPELPFKLRAYPDSLLGLWLEAAPPAGEVWDDFMLGVFGAELTAFGTGPAGALPVKSVLAYPMLGIKGDIAGQKYQACAARNRIDGSTSCYCKIDGIPTGVFVASYPKEEPILLAPVIKFCQ